MKKPPIPKNEAERLHALESLSIVYSPAEERFDRITTLAQQLFNAPISLVSLITEKCQWFKSIKGLDADSTTRELAVCAHTINSDEAYIIPDISKDPDFYDHPFVNDEPYLRFYAGKPIKYNNYNVGTFCVIDFKPRVFTSSEIELLCQLASWVETELRVTALSESQIKLLEERDEAKRQALIDPLTKVWNRKGMEELFMRELSVAVREEYNIFLMALDIDYYKEVNDTYGHMAGDAVLVKVAERIRSSVRGHDVIVRYGGDEFIVLANNCPTKAGMQLAGRILAHISNEPIEYRDFKLSISVTIGTSSALATDGLQVLDLVNAADTALYAAKQAGRNCIRYAPAETSTQNAK